MSFFLGFTEELIKLAQTGKMLFDPKTNTWKRGKTVPDPEAAAKRRAAAQKELQPKPGPFPSRYRYPAPGSAGTGGSGVLKRLPKYRRETGQSVIP